MNGWISEYKRMDGCIEEDEWMNRRGWMNESGGWMVEWKSMNGWMEEDGWMEEIG